MLHKETVTSEIVYKTCDFCGTREGWPSRCLGCGKDVCRTCGVLWYDDPFTNEHFGDSYKTVCCSCDSLTTGFTPQTLAIQAKAEADMDTIVKAWQLECRQG
jgi:hypothetical protein